MSFLIRSIRQHPKTWFYSCWLLINLVQSAGTQLLDDEAYYWVYSRFLDWGYFDHPPMIAVLIKAGFAIFKNELGVRLFMAIMNTATLWLIQKMLLADNDRLFYAIALSMGVLQIGGILAVPDIPLTFFTALFFFQYKRFLDKTDAGQGLLLGVVMALMLYSKYHGILIILLTLLSNRNWRLTAMHGSRPLPAWSYLLHTCGGNTHTISLLFNITSVNGMHPPTVYPLRLNIFLARSCLPVP